MKQPIATLSAKKIVEMYTPSGSSEAHDEPRRSGRSRKAVACAEKSNGAPGEAGMKAAYQYLDGTFESPASAAEHWLVERQLVNYYVRKLVAQGVPRSERSASTPVGETASEDVAVSEAAEEYKDVYEKWCVAWEYAAE